MKDYCSLFPDIFRGKYIGDCCKKHDNACGQAGSYCFLSTISPFYKCLRNKLSLPYSVGIVFVGSLFCLIKWPYLLVRKYLYRRTL